MLLQVVNDKSFFGRDTEQAHLLAQLKQAPDNMLLLLGPRSSGKTRFLKEVLSSDRSGTPVSFFSSREELSHARVLAARLWHELDAQLNAMDGPNQPAKVSLSPLPAATSHMNVVILAYGATLATREGALMSPPVICIDHADVLMDWYEGFSTTQTDIKALLNFLVQVRALHVGAHQCL